MGPEFPNEPAGPLPIGPAKAAAAATAATVVAADGALVIVDDEVLEFVCVGEGGSSQGVSCLIGVVPHRLVENKSSDGLRFGKCSLLILLSLFVKCCCCLALSLLGSSLLNLFADDESFVFAIEVVKLLSK